MPEIFLESNSSTEGWSSWGTNNSFKTIHSYWIGLRRATNNSTWSRRCPESIRGTVRLLCNEGNTFRISLDLSKEACLSAIRRFRSRRGLPKVIDSNNWTNFIGACNGLMEIQRLLARQVGQDDLKNFCANKGISWVTIPTCGPHFGGLSEAGLKSMKRLLRRQMGRIVLNFEELATILPQIEQILNSRPLTPLSTDPNDVQVLTSVHFLLGSPLTALPSSNEDDTEVSCLQRWRLIQLLLQRLWKRWTRQNLLTNQIRTKWQLKKTNLAVNGVVFVTDDNHPLYIGL